MSVSAAAHKDEALLILTIRSANGPPFVCAAHDRKQAKEQVALHIRGRQAPRVIVDEWKLSPYPPPYTDPWKHVGAFELPVTP